MELNLREGSTFEEPISKKTKHFETDKRQGESIFFKKIWPTDGASACWQIGLDRRQLGLVSEKGPIEDHRNYFLVPFEN